MAYTIRYGHPRARTARPPTHVQVRGAGAVPLRETRAEQPAGDGMGNHGGVGRSGRRQAIPRGTHTHTHTHTQCQNGAGSSS
jgi:hypothetical protein